MVSGDRQVVVGEKGPFWSMQREFSRHFGRIDVLCPKPAAEVVTRTIHERVHFHPAPIERRGVSGGGPLVRWIAEEGARLVREHDIGLVVSHDYGTFTNGRGAWRITRTTGVPFVSEIHHVPGHPVAADTHERVEKLLTRVYVRWARTRAAGFRVVNATEMPALLRAWGVPEARIHVLPSQYLELDVFRPEAAPVAQDVVFAGRTVANKRVDVLVEALALLKAAGQPTSALLIGKGPLRPKVEALARARGVDVRFLDWVAEPAQLAAHYRASRACVCASTCEGGPRFTVEAMACGVPVVSTPVGIMPDLLADGGAGRLVGWSARELADGLRAVLSDEANRKVLGAEAARRVQRFDYATALARYADGLKAIARGAHAGEPA
jgi:glycosyltransferase involved in cell wall biosynthesis